MQGEERVHARDRQFGTFEQVRAIRDPHLGNGYHDPGYFTTDEPATDPAPVWPYGLAADFVLATLAVLLTIRQRRRI